MTNISAGAPNQALPHWKEGTKYVVEGGRSLILINGGAAIGILTFIGNSHPQAYGIISALTWFAWGALAGVVLFVFAYVAQLQYGNRALGVKYAEVAAWVAHWLGYFATAFSIGFFVRGMYAAASGFSEQFPGPKAAPAELTGKAWTLMAPMTPDRWINLVAAALGAIGAIVLFNGSFAFETFGQYYDNASIEAQTARNLTRRVKQRIGLGLILASFILQGVAQCFD